jgi:hypothetical protein
MIYTVAEISQIVNLSKASIYTKLKQKELHEHIIKKQGVTYLDEIALKLIQDSLKDFINDDINDFKDDINAFNHNPLNGEVATDIDYINSLKVDINYLKIENERLWKELQIKNLQINECNKRLSDEQNLHKNTQILLREKPQQDMKLLEDHFKDLDNSLIEVRERMEVRKNKSITKNIFQKIFQK